MRTHLRFLLTRLDAPHVGLTAIACTEGPAAHGRTLASIGESSIQPSRSILHHVHNIHAYTSLHNTTVRWLYARRGSFQRMRSKKCTHILPFHHIRLNVYTGSKQLLSAIHQRQQRTNAAPHNEVMLLESEVSGSDDRNAPVPL